MILRIVYVKLESMKNSTLEFEILLEKFTRSKVFNRESPEFLMKFSILFLICIHGSPLQSELTQLEIEEPEVVSRKVNKLKNAIYAPLMALKRTREDRIGLDLSKLIIKRIETITS